MRYCFWFIFCVVLSNILFGDFYGFHPKSRLYLGGGYDKFNPSKAFLRCLKYDGIESISQNKAVTSSFEITGVSSAHEFHQKIGFSSFLEGSYLFTKGEASVSYDFEENFSQNSLTWLVMLKADYGNFVLKNPRLDPKSLTLPTKFLMSRCGRELVTEEKRSIMVFSLLSLKDIKQSQKKKLEAKLSILSKGPMFDVSFTSAYKDFMSKASSMGEISMKIFSHGGKGLSEFKNLLNLKAFMSYHKILETFNAYIKSMDAHAAAPIFYMTSDLESFVERKISLPLFRRQTLLEIYFRYQSLSSKVYKINSLLDSFELSSEEFDYYERIRRKAYASLNHLKKSAQNCFDLTRQEGCFYPEEEVDPVTSKNLRDLRCEKLRLKALDFSLIEKDFYQMAKRRNFYPMFDNTLRPHKILAWKACKSMG